MKSSTALRKARRLIASCKVKHVCTAIDSVGGETTDVAQRLEKIFRGEGLISLEGYLEDRYPDFNGYRDSVDYSAFADEMRNYRLAWIDWMIEGYEAVGD